jgi:hypothetical protein
MKSTIGSLSRLVQTNEKRPSASILIGLAGVQRYQSAVAVGLVGLVAGVIRALDWFGGQFCAIGRRKWTH